MENKITQFSIKNFKSIKSADLECGRINVFIGKPNVGKSNILEALAMLGVMGSSPGTHSFNELIRYESLNNLFYNQNYRDTISINTNLGLAKLKFDIDGGRFYILVGEKTEKSYKKNGCCR